MAIESLQESRKSALRKNNSKIKKIKYHKNKEKITSLDRE